MTDEIQDPPPNAFAAPAHADNGSPEQAREYHHPRKYSSTYQGRKPDVVLATAEEALRDALGPHQGPGSRRGIPRLCRRVHGSPDRGGRDRRRRRRTCRSRHRPEAVCASIWSGIVTFTSTHATASPWRCISATRPGSDEVRAEYDGWRGHRLGSQEVFRSTLPWPASTCCSSAISTRPAAVDRAPRRPRAGRDLLHLLQPGQGSDPEGRDRWRPGPGSAFVRSRPAVGRISRRCREGLVGPGRRQRPARKAQHGPTSTFGWLPRRGRPRLDRYHVALEVKGYRGMSPTGCFWGPVTKQRLDLNKWPKGKPNSRFATVVFRTNGFSFAGRAFYHPYDRAPMSDHPQWKTELPHLIWTSSHTIVDYLEEFQSLLMSGDYLGI